MTVDDTPEPPEKEHYRHPENAATVSLEDKTTTEKLEHDVPKKWDI